MTNDLREKINEKFYEFRKLEYDFDNSAHRDELLDEIMSLIEQSKPDPLSVDLMQGCFFKNSGSIRETSHGYTYAIGILNRKDDGYGILFWADTRQNALDFCVKHGLRVVNEEESK